jgi:hypothetical protein
MIVDRVQQGSAQIEKDCRVGRMCPGEIFVGGHFFWVSHDRVPTGFGCVFGVQQKNLSEVDFLRPLELCFALGFRS